MSNRYLLLFVLILIFSSTLSSQITYRALTGGNWEDPIWNHPGYPGIEDNVIIDGVSVTLTGSNNYQVKSLTLTNAGQNQNPTNLTLIEGNLEIQGKFSLISDQNTDPSFTQISVILNTSSILVKDNFEVLKSESDTNNGGILIESNGNSRIEVIKDFTIKINAASQVVQNKLAFSQTSKLKVFGNFKVDVFNNNIFNFLLSESSSIDTDKSVTLNGFNNSRINFTYNSLATSTIKGNLVAKGSNPNGNNIELNFNIGRFNINGDVKLSSNDPSQKVKMHLNGLENSVNIYGGIKYEALHENTLSIVVDNKSTLEVGRSIERPTSFGNLFMMPTSMLVFNYDSISTLPSNEVANNGNDIFEMTNVRLVNTSGEPVQLDGPMMFNTNLTLEQGVIKTDSTNILILGDNAVITGANETTYIDGPIEKRGMSSDPIILPVGKEGTYAPIEISPISNPGSIIRGEFFGDPPPIGGVPPDLNQINDKQHWIIDRVSGNEPIDVVLNWRDGEQAGISGMDSITTTYFNRNTGEWVDAGRGNVIGGNGPGEAGSIGSDMLGDPPPIGAVIITIGNVSTNSVLPVELIEFTGQKQDQSVLLKWTTASEINVRNFELERSIDGIDFVKIGSHDALGDATATTRYGFQDKRPRNGMNYYRLRTVDLDGTENVSRIVSAEFNNFDTPIAVPNPVREQLLVIGLDKNSYQAMVEIFNSTGQMLFQQEVGINNGRLELQMEAVNITFRGTYFIRIADTARTHNLTILKQ